MADNHALMCDIWIYHRSFDADLRCSVPQRDHLVSVHTDRDTKGPGQTKVGDLDAAVLVNQEILGLHVSVENSPLVTEQDVLQQLTETNQVNSTYYL